jgi:hypothetical protein
VLRESSGKSISDLDTEVHGLIVHQGLDGNFDESLDSEDEDAVGLGNQSIEVIDEDSGVRFQCIPLNYYDDNGEALLQVRFASFSDAAKEDNDDVVAINSEVIDGVMQVHCGGADGWMLAEFDIKNVDKIKDRLLHEAPQMLITPYYGLGLGNEYSREIALDVMQFLLDVVGLVPAVGEIADGINVGISTARGDYEEAAITTAGMLPFVGIVSGAGKLVDKVKTGYHWMKEVFSFGKKPVNQLADVSDMIKPLGRGSTGRTIPNNLKEQLVMKEAMLNAFGVEKLTVLKFPMTDPRWLYKDGWEKVAYHNDGVEVHFVRNKLTQQVDDFKFKDKPKQ